MLPAEALRAFVRLGLSGIVARHHLRRHRPSGWLGFIACGPTGTGKTLTAEIACRVFGLDRDATIRLVESETERSLWGRRVGGAGAMTLDPADVLGFPLLCLDELDKAPGSLRVATLKLLQGEARVAGEGTQIVEVAPTVLATYNGGAGLVPDEYRRRCVVLDTAPIASLLGDLDEAARDVLAPGVLPVFRLADLVPPAHELTDHDRKWVRSMLREGLTDDGRRMLNMVGIESLALGRAALAGDGDLRRAAAATAADYLTCAYLVGEAFAGLPDELRSVLGGPLAPDAETAALEREHMEATAKQRRLARETEQLDLTGARAAVAAKLSDASTAIKSVPPRLRDIAAGVRGQLANLRDDVLRSRNRQRLEELTGLAEPVVARADAIAQEIAGERALVADTEIAIRETLYEARALDDAIGQVRRMLNRTTARTNENVIRALLALGVVTKHSERYIANVPTFGKWPPVMRSVHRTRYWYEDVLGRRHESADLDDYGPGTGARDALSAKLDQLVGERKALDRRRDALTRGPVPALPEPTRPALSAASVLLDVAPPTDPPPVGEVTFGVHMSCGCTTAIDGRCAVHR